LILPENGVGERALRPVTLEDSLDRATRAARIVEH
jgi:hypothetical protein